MAALLYVSCADAQAIELLELDAAGGLRRRGTVAVPGPAGAAMSMPLALSADRRRLYAAVRKKPFPLASFAVGDDGGLSQLGTDELPEAMAYLSVFGGHVLGASYPGSVVASMLIGADGVARGPARHVMATPEKAHCILPDPSGRFVFVPCLGGDTVLRLGFDPASGRFAEFGRVAIRPGAGPRHIVFDGTGDRAYLLNELDGTIEVYDYAAQTGALTPRQMVRQVPADAPGQIKAADLHLTPDGRFLYASERLTNTLSAWRVGADGGLEPIGSVACEAGPRGFAISPDGRFLLCAGQQSHHVGVFAIDPSEGGLAAVGRFAVGANPNWIEFHAGK